jgi:nucleoside-diphosphate-sugar epimerase
MKIAILGATSQIARDLIVSFSKTEDHCLHLFARRPDAVSEWAESAGLGGLHKIQNFETMQRHEFDAIINFVGVGDPERLAAMGNAIFDVTLKYDELALSYLSTRPSCRYLFLSSGSAYGSTFDQPVTIESRANIPINRLSPNDWYGVAKLHAESRHRAHPDFAITDIRIFNYFSSSQDVSARFLMSDILRSIISCSTLKTSAGNIVRDYLHPSDFCRLVCALLGSPPRNFPVDAYSLAPVDKMSLLEILAKEAGLKYELTPSAGLNATGTKPNYYSLNRSASEFGYQPRMTSVEGVLSGVREILRSADAHTSIASAAQGSFGSLK